MKVEDQYIADLLSRFEREDLLSAAAAMTRTARDLIAKLELERDEARSRLAEVIEVPEEKGPCDPIEQMEHARGVALLGREGLREAVEEWLR